MDNIKNKHYKDMNLRILIYLNPSNINKVTHKFNLNSDSGFIMVTKGIDALNEISNNHYYILVPTNDFDWKFPENVSIIKYPYMNDALNNRYHFDSLFLSNIFSTYRHDIDLCWTMLPENVANLKAFFSKRREEIPVFCYSNWLQNSNSNYEPSYKWRTIEGAVDCNAFGYQSNHMLDYMKDNTFKGIDIDYSKFHRITPKTDLIDISDSVVNGKIVFNHRISADSYFNDMLEIIKDDLILPLWVTNINNSVKINHNLVEYNNIKKREDYFKELKKVRFGISYHIGYSMWSMSVIDLMICGKVVLVPRLNAFIEMFGEDYKYFFDDKKDFLEKFNSLQTVNEGELLLWGAYNRERAENLFTWNVLAEQLNKIFKNIITKKTTKKTKSVLDVINKRGKISKQELINLNLTDYGRMCSRAWNKTRIELMRDFGVKDDVSKTETIFYSSNTEITKDTLF
tara:strand:+ start:1192 stop:2559 length:1368 start_codon:yes stop_codon:yes gene_type:complete